MRLVTRGLGGGQDVGLVLQGFTLELAVRIIRGGRSAAKKVYDNFIEEFTIAAKLLEINGKDLISPIINKRKYTVDESIEHTVHVKDISVKKRKDQSNASVFAKVLNISRGSDG